MPAWGSHFEFCDAPAGNGPCNCLQIKRFYDGLPSTYVPAKPLVDPARPPKPQMEQPIIDPEEVLKVCAKEAGPDFHEEAVKQLLKTHDGTDPAFGNMAAELSEKLEKKHVPVKIPPKKRRPVIRESNTAFHYESGSLGDVVSDLLDEIFN